MSELNESDWDRCTSIFDFGVVTRWEMLSSGRGESGMGECERELEEERELSWMMMISADRRSSLSLSLSLIRDEIDRLALRLSVKEVLRCKLFTSIH